MKMFLTVVVALVLSAHIHASDPGAPVLVSSQGFLVNDPFANMNPEEMRANMRQQQMDMITLRLEVYAEPKVIQLIAKFTHDLFLALIENGFTEEQAIEIVKSNGMPNRH